MEFIIWVLFLAAAVFGVINLFQGDILWGLILLDVAFFLGGGRHMMGYRR
jgi:hypothetical protein